MALGGNMKKSSAKKPSGLMKDINLTKKTAKKPAKAKSEAAPKKKAAPVKLSAAKAAPVKEAPVKSQPIQFVAEVTPLKTLKDAKLLLSPSKRKKVRKTKVYLEGKLTIGNVKEFQAEIGPIFNDYDFVDFFLKDVVELDLSYMQMLSYFKYCHAPKLNKTVTVDSELPGNIKKIIVKAGFEDLMFIPKLV